MSFSAAVQWWEDWQLRLLVLASLFFQYFLFVATIVRKRRVPHWFRALIWLAYQGGDVVAVYALATLFNRHHKEETLALSNPATAHLQMLWAPILLVHLGGQDGITAYSIEDNENWRRHLLVSVSQITVAIYVFHKSWWSGDKVLLRAAILLFVPGILKCLEKPWALMNATATSIMNSDDSRMQEATLYEDDGVHKDGIIDSLEKYVQAAAASVAELEAKPSELFDDEVADQPYHLFVDVGHPYSVRHRNLRLVAPHAARADVHGLVRLSLSKAFNRLYTKHKASFGGLLRAAVALVALVVIGLFHRSHRGVYDRADIVVTYILLGCTAALELVSASLVLGSGLPLPDDKLAQYNLVGCLARGEKHPRFLALQGRLLGARLQLDRLWCTSAPEPSPDITGLVYDHVARGWKDYIGKSEYDATTGEWKKTTSDLEAYRQFNDSRGEQTLKREGCIDRNSIEESLRMPFDESVLIWHLATEFCYFDHVDTGKAAIRHSRTVSNYMVYLLFIKPEMLIPGARSKLFRATYHELRKMLKPPPDDEEAVELEPARKKASPPREKNEMVREVIQKVKRNIGLGSGDLVYKAWAVAQELIEFAKEKEPDCIEFIDVMRVLCRAKKKADEFIDIKNKKRDEIWNKLMVVMVPAQQKANEFISIGIKRNMAEEATERKKNFMMVIKEAAKDKVELIIKDEATMNQTEEKSTDNSKFSTKTKAEPSSKPNDIEEETTSVLTVQEFSKQAEEAISKLLEDEKNKFMDGWRKAKEKATDFIKEAKKFIGEEENKSQTKEEKNITDLLKSATKKAAEFVNKNDQSSMEEEESVQAVKQFSNQAREAINLVEKEMEKLMHGKSEAKDEAEDFIKKANKFINGEKNKSQTKDVKKITGLLESAMKAYEFIKNEQKNRAEESVNAVKEFSEKAGEVIKLVEKEDKKLADLMRRNPIANEEHMIRGREHADDKMWAVILGVWVEMLCFSASRCRGYLHAKSLSNGGEYLSYVWLLLYYMGMETMPERMQRRKLPVAGDTGALVKTLTDEEGDEELAQLRRRTATPTPPASSRVGATAIESSTGLAQAWHDHIVDIASPRVAKDFYILGRKGTREPRLGSTYPGQG